MFARNPASQGGRSQKKYVHVAEGRLGGTKVAVTRKGGPPGNSSPGPAVQKIRRGRRGKNYVFLKRRAWGKPNFPRSI